MYDMTKVYENLINIHCDFSFLFLNGVFGGILKILFDKNKKINYDIVKVLYSLMLSGITAIFIGIIYIIQFDKLTLNCKDDLYIFIFIGFVSGIFGVIIIEEFIFNVTLLIQKSFKDGYVKILTIFKKIKDILK